MDTSKTAEEMALDDPMNAAGGWRSTRTYPEGCSASFQARPGYGAVPSIQRVRLTVCTHSTCK